METGHIGLNVTDLARSRAFYQRVLGLEQVGQGEQPSRYAFLSRDGRLVLTLWEQSEGTFPTDQPGLHHLSFQVASMNEVRTAEATLRELGAELTHEGPVAHGEGASSGGIFFTDPDGIRLEIYALDGAQALAAPAGTAPTCGFF